jgi:hypothetical protein
MFFGKNGETPTQAGLLTTHKLPHYIKLGWRYDVISCEGEGTWINDLYYLYRVQRINDPSNQVYYVRSPFKLPEKFWVRKLISQSVQYEILSNKDECLPKHLLRAVEQNALPAAA